MTLDPTLPQSSEDRRRSRQLSMQPVQPPRRVPGYEPVRLLGIGAYGEVWVAIDQNTGRQVAIKFYTHRGGLDWSLLSREVEKLRFLFSDRYVVQLLDVGWDADPPYYVMEYLERGSLADYLEKEGPLPAEEAVNIFRDVTVGLVHAHGKGVLHCDLKPGNVLLDADHKPRLADFGQARLSDEQSPALGTLFYMAPEQADLTAVPEASWDVYALGALLYCMLTGAPPYRTSEAVAELERQPDLPARLAAYRQWVATAPPPTAHRRLRGVDRRLAEIIDRCLAVDPKRRFSNPQAVLDALDARALRRARRPLLVLGAIGPLVLLLVVAMFAWKAFDAAMQQSRSALLARALDTNRFAAQSVAKAVAYDIDRRYQAVTQIAADPALQARLREASASEELAALLRRVQSAELPDEQRYRHQLELVAHPVVKRLQERLDELVAAADMPRAHSWFITDHRGTQLARAPIVFDVEPHSGLTVGKDYSWRSYFHGGPQDLTPGTAVAPDQHVRRPSLSAVLRSQATNEWIVAISTPIQDGDAFLGVAALTVQVGRFAEFDDRDDQFWVLVDSRPGPDHGLILQHRLFRCYAQRGERLPERFQDYRVPLEQLLPAGSDVAVYATYADPMAQDEQGEAFAGVWLAALARIRVQDQDAHLVAVVQENSAAVVGSVRALGGQLLEIGGWALAVLLLVMVGLWGLVVALSEETGSPVSVRRWLRGWAGLRSETNGSRRPAGERTAAAEAEATAAYRPDR